MRFRKIRCGVFMFSLFIIVCHTSANIYEDFVKFNQKFNKIYAEENAEFKRRYQIYQENVKLQLWLNQSQPVLSAWYGETKFSDLSQQEFKELYLSDILARPMDKLINMTTPLSRLKQLNIPAKLDWRNYLNYSVISSVKNQKKCGGCWAFSTVETVESMYAKKTHTSPPDLSVQEVIDCSSNNYGCNGGDTCRALEWMVNAKPAIVSESVYPLTDVSNECMMLPNDTKSTRVHVKDYKCYKLLNKEDDILQLLQQGPVAASVDATTWSNYQGGIIQYHCEAFNNHAVQIVGYDMTGEVPYYIVRNSWGTDFGNDGYLNIKIGENVCGIAMEIVTADVYP